MRKVRSLQLKFGQVPIDKTVIDTRCRDDLPGFLIGLQALCSMDGFCDELFALLDAKLFQNADRSVGRPGMDLWQIFVLGMLKQVLKVDFDRTHDMANNHKTVRQFLGHADLFEPEQEHTLRTIIDNVNLLTPEPLAEISLLVVRCGHGLPGRSTDQKFGARVDSFVVETDVHYPTDTGLLWDSMRVLLRTVGHDYRKYRLAGWRNWRHWRQKTYKLSQNVRQTRKAQRGDVIAYLRCCRGLVARLRETHQVHGPPDANTRGRVSRFIWHAERQIDQVDRRLLQGQSIPNAEKVHSVFEEHTRWITKGKAGVPVELGVPVSVIEDHRGFVLNHTIMWDGSDAHYAVPPIEQTQARFPNLVAVSFDRGYHSPGNRRRLDDLLTVNALPGKGYLSKAERAREQDPAFADMRKQHPGIESCINDLEHRGLDRIRSYGADGFARMVGLSILAANIHRLGLILRGASKTVPRAA